MHRRGPFTMYYDSGCPFCIRMVKLFRSVLGLHDSRLLAAQSDADRHEEMRQMKSWIVITSSGEHLHGWKAVSVVVSESRWFWPIGLFLGWGPLLPIGEAFYHCIERSRPALSKLTSFMNTDPPKH